MCSFCLCVEKSFEFCVKENSGSESTVSISSSLSNSTVKILSSASFEVLPLDAETLKRGEGDKPISQLVRYDTFKLILKSHSSYVIQIAGMRFEWLLNLLCH